uniref:RING-type domain-containing protein n=1 Tax=Athene cunicularia TaxID=194338 RepID=A0A663N2M3_ATHCN
MERGPGDDPSGTLPPAPQGCSFPPAFALSPPACVLCGREPGAPGGSVGCGPAAATSCALPGGVGLAGEALRLLLTGLLCSFQRCFVCGESGAAITCSWEGCDRNFHLPCAIEGECVTEYFPPNRYLSFCREHRPEQEVEAAPEENTNCLICLEPVGDRKSFHTMVCPACKHAWFHRVCIQVGAGHALSAGISFNCPHCRNEHDFLRAMVTMGIRIPLRLSSWENEPQDEILFEMYSHCDAHECLCPRGREYAEEQGPWEVLLCISCAAEGTHRRCSNVRNSWVIWECDTCAGLGNGKRQSTFMPLGWGQGPGKAWQQFPRRGLTDSLCPRRHHGRVLLTF